MADINIIVERCLVRLNHIEIWIEKVRREHQMIIAQLGSIKEEVTNQKKKHHNNNVSTIVSEPEVDVVTYILMILERNKRPLNINEISEHLLKDYPDVIPTQIINIKNYLYRHIRKGLKKGMLSHYNTNDGIRTDYVPARWLSANGNLMI